jgi:putative transposase
MGISSRPYHMDNPSGIYFVTFTIVFWIDVFIRNSYKNEFVKSLNYCIQQKGLNVHAWCIMSSHVHLIISAKNSDLHNLSDIIRDIKKYTANTIIKSITNDPESRRDWMLDKFSFAASKNSRNNNYQFWQQDNQAKELFSNDFMMQKLNYIHQNPVEEGWVDEPEHYTYSSARDYCGRKGLVEIAFLY